MRGAKADASQSQTTTTPRSDRSDRRGDVSGALTTYYDDLMMGDDGGAAARSQGAGSRRQVEREDGGGRGGNACEHQESTRTTPTLYSTCTVAVHVLLHQSCTYTPPTTHPGHGGSWRPCWLPVDHAWRYGGRYPTCIALSARADVHRATYRRAVETGFVFADSRGHVRTGQRAARAAGRGGWVCEWL